MRYGLSRWDVLRLYLDGGTVAIDNIAAERAIRPIAVGCNNWLFAGSDAGEKRTANIPTLIESAKPNGLEPEHYLAAVIGGISDLTNGTAAFGLRRSKLFMWVIPAGFIIQTALDSLRKGHRLLATIAALNAEACGNFRAAVPVGV
jgi:hypothetical protein